MSTSFILQVPSKLNRWLRAGRYGLPSHPATQLPSHPATLIPNHLATPSPAIVLTVVATVGMAKSGMGILGRLGQVFRAQVGDWVRGAEDPEAMLDRAVMDMQQELLQLRQAIAQAIATQKRTERQCHQTALRVKEWYNRAQLALNQGDEDQARDALAQRHTYQRMQSQLASHLDAQKTVIANLKTNLRDLEVKIADVRTRRDMYIARARSAEASQRIQEMMGQVGQGRSLGTLSQMEDRVLDLEAQASAMAELNQTIQSQSLEDRFEALEGSAATEVEQALAAMKTRPSERSPEG